MADAAGLAACTTTTRRIVVPPLALPTGTTLDRTLVHRSSGRGGCRLLPRRETVREHFATTGRPHGHGYTSRNLADGTAYYAFDRGLITFIVLDTVNQGGGPNGSLDQNQFRWLERQLTAASSRLLIVFSHRTIATMDNPLLAPGEAGPRVLGPQVRDLLLRFPNVIAWVNGHTHHYQVIGHARPAGSPFAGGFWEVNTASHIDWPQQSRLVEVADNRVGIDGARATVFDRNVELIVPAPVWMAAA
jgi:hypothetical protein